MLVSQFRETPARGHRAPIDLADVTLPTAGHPGHASFFGNGPLLALHAALGMSLILAALNRLTTRRARRQRPIPSPPSYAPNDQLWAASILAIPQADVRADRRVGARSPRPYSSLSVTLVIASPQGRPSIQPRRTCWR
jgi:hypothetical protein